ncbi:hypothetical protein [Asaia spathodeae]|uniref:Uncharacterized protein n=1 Tax=Asaia spathodeae TaxID=657016 RepID=A0ABX2P8J1_9PROT|nr:hypothetical protein [Asaia spathodeae]GBR18759.1 hypothetical protein AA105894_2145 [Asaia spathodeae NBRC 105894]
MNRHDLIYRLERFLRSKLQCGFKCVNRELSLNITENIKNITDIDGKEVIVDGTVCLVEEQFSIYLKTYIMLLEGDLPQSEAEDIFSDAECPISPDDKVLFVLQWSD